MSVTNNLYKYGLNYNYIKNIRTKINNGKEDCYKDEDVRKLISAVIGLSKTIDQLNKKVIDSIKVNHETKDNNDIEEERFNYLLNSINVINKNLFNRKVCPAGKSQQHCDFNFKCNECWIDTANNLSQSEIRKLKNVKFDDQLEEMCKIMFPIVMKDVVNEINLENFIVYCQPIIDVVESQSAETWIHQILCNKCRLFRCDNFVIPDHFDNYETYGFRYMLLNTDSIIEFIHYDPKHDKTYISIMVMDISKTKALLM